MENRDAVQHADEAAIEGVCQCGKDIEDCACLNGHECTCGGDSRLCGVAPVEMVGLSGPKPSA